MFLDSLSSLLQRKPVILQLLRFIAIGAINTALDFIILNFVTKSLGVTSGVELGVLNVLSFTAAMIQSYFWNKAWAFGSNNAIGLLQNALRLLVVGGLGLIAFLAVVIGSGYEATGLFYLLVLAGFVITEILVWIGFQIHMDFQSGAGTQFASFFVVSIIGLLINSAIIVIATHVITPYVENTINPDVIKNIAKIFATGFSLVWNFVGYKILVFKK